MEQSPNTPESPEQQEKRSASEMERRTFLKLGLAITGVFAGGTLLSAASVVDKVFATQQEFTDKYPYKPHYAMVVRQDNCIDCERCKAACAKTNDVPRYGYRTQILQQVDPEAIDRRREFIPVLCNQCNNPACTRACPTGATYKDKQNGIVMVDKDKCIGCKTCMSACPFNARYYNEETKAVDKCNFCFDTRLTQGETTTACAAACPARVRIFGDLSDPQSEVFQRVHNIEKSVWVLRPETGVKPNVFYTKG
ncbi:MAG: 4Fe-4S dicluster domain-containing protein [Actinobacteria bacterium]|nr:4Fe-4S dicluster domain-containing protein [Actinomycetota bacterium]MCL5883667.1 4Fe-4S dicluster domain-containing protein [Actinomycetota bacterium]